MLANGNLGRLRELMCGFGVPQTSPSHCPCSAACSSFLPACRCFFLFRVTRRTYELRSDFKFVASYSLHTHCTLCGKLNCGMLGHIKTYMSMSVPPCTTIDLSTARRKRRATDPLNRWCRRMPSEYLSLPLYLSISPSLSFSPPLSISPSLSIYPSIYLSIQLSIHLSLHLLICLSNCLSIYLSISLSLSVSISLPIYPSIHPSIHLSLSLPLSAGPPK